MVANRIAHLFDGDGAFMVNGKTAPKGKAAVPLNLKGGEALAAAISKYWSPRSVTQLGVKAGCSRETVRRYCEGELKPGDILDAICEVLRVDPAKIVEGIVVTKVSLPAEYEAAPVSRIEGMLKDILDTPAGDFLGAQIEAVHRKLFPNDHG